MLLNKIDSGKQMQRLEYNDFGWSLLSFKRFKFTIGEKRHG